MIVDSSAIIGIILREPGWQGLVGKLTDSTNPAVGAPTLAETGVVLTAKLGPSAPGLLSRFLQESGLAVIPFGEVHWPIAITAYTRFGKGRHTANLNFGDCLTYAVAHFAGEPLLFTGDDFSRTDLPAA